MGQKIISLSQFKSTATQMFRELKQTRNHVILTQNGTATAVVQDIDSFESNKLALIILKLMVQGETNIKNGNLVDQETVFRNIRKNYRKVMKKYQVKWTKTTQYDLEEITED